MNKQLRAKTMEWMSLERKTMEQRKIADEFYDDQLMRLIEKEFVRNNKDLVFEKVQYLVVSVGTSYEPIVLDIKLFNPTRILFLYTKTSEKTLNKVVDYCELSPERYEKSEVSEVESTDIYREIKRIYLKWKKPERMYIDFTGGTKAMSAACALAGAMIDIQMVYVSSRDYLVDFRKPNPGSEELAYIENPLAVFGDLEINKAFELFGKYNFAGAGSKLEVLKEKIPDADLRQQLQFVYLLARAYEAWDALDFVPASESMRELNRQIRRDRKLHSEYLLMDYADLIGVQARILEALEKIPELQKKDKITGKDRRIEILKSTEMIHALIFTMYQNACTRESQEKYDMATLLLYRLLEMIEQRRLIHYEIFASAPVYENMRFDAFGQNVFKYIPAENRVNELKNRNYEIKKALFKNTSNRELPGIIALLDGYMLLAAMEDPIITESGRGVVNELKQIRSKLFLRNNSIFAHGLGPVGIDDYCRFRDFVRETFERFCVIENVDFGTYNRNMQWIMPLRSDNYLTGWEE